MGVLVARHHSHVLLCAHVCTLVSLEVLAQSCAAAWRKTAFAAGGKTKGSYLGNWVTMVLLTDEMEGSAGKLASSFFKNPPELIICFAQ